MAVNKQEEAPSRASNFSTRDWLLLRPLQIVGPADGSSYIVDYYGARLTRLTITNDTYRKPHLAL